jgi:orotidine-5'-phosphate decarboxylase
VPGIRTAGADPDDQARPAPPATAQGGGAGFLVVGRAVTAAPARAAAAAHLADSIVPSS